jgi:hypothetical protein
VRALRNPDIYLPVTGYLKIKSNDRLMIDNLVDVPHLLSGKEF